MIKIWKFPDAPQRLKNLHRRNMGITQPEWLMQVSPELLDAAEAGLINLEPRGNVFRYHLPDQTTVFVGLTDFFSFRTEKGSDRRADDRTI